MPAESEDPSRSGECLDKDVCEMAIDVPEVWSSDNESVLELAIPVPEVWSSDDEGDGEGEQQLTSGGASGDVSRSNAVASALRRLQEVESHNVAPRRLADPSSVGAIALAEFGSEAFAPAVAHRCDVVRYDETVGERAEAFAERYFATTGCPCIVEGVPEAERWPACERWHDPATFLRNHGTVPVQITEMASALGGKPMRIELPLSAFAEYSRETTADWPYYSWERQWDGPRAALLSDFSVPAPFSDDLYDTNEETRDFLPLSCHLFVLVGGPRSGSNMHKDPKWTSAWNTLLCGRKRWVLFPPETPADAIGAAEGNYRSAGAPAYWWLDHYPRLCAEGAARGMVDVVQRPGDTIFIPSGWWHAVLNLPDEGGVTVCCTRNLLLPQSLPKVWPAMRDKYPDFARRFARFVRARRPDAAAFLPPEAADIVEPRPALVGEVGWCIERRHCKDLSLLECREAFIRGGRPLIITGLGDALLSQECRGLSREWLRENLGMKAVAVQHGSPSMGAADDRGPELLTVAEFCRRLDEGEDLYLYDVSLPLQLPTLLEHIRVPRYFAHCRLQQTRLRQCFDRSWPTLFIGARGTRSRLHVDQWHGHFWMTLVSGSKRDCVHNELHLLAAFQ